MKQMIANRLLKQWVRNIELEDGEQMAALLLFERNGDTFLNTVALKMEGNSGEQKLVVSRMISSINIEDAL